MAGECILFGLEDEDTHYAFWLEMINVNKLGLFTMKTP